MQHVSSDFTDMSGGNSTLHYPAYGVNISWTKQENLSYQFFTIGTSSIGGSDFIPGSGAAPSFANQFAYTDYTAYMLSGSVSRNIGQYTYGAFGAQGEVQLDNTSLLFLPGFDPVIGDFILTGRPINIATGFIDGTNNVQETISLFYGQTTAPKNDIGTRQITLDAFDFFDYLQQFQSKAAGPIAAANKGCYINQYANVIIGDLLSEAGLATSQYIAEQSTQQPIGFYSPFGLYIGDIIQALCEAEQALFFFDENGIAHFWNRQHLQVNNSSVWTFDETDIFELTPEDTPIINDVQVQANPRAVQSNQLIWTLSAPVEIPAPTSTAVLTNLCTNPTFYLAGTNNWSAAGGGAISGVTATGWNDVYYASVTSTGATQYVFNTIACSINTNYVAQCHVNGTPGAVITIEANENGVTLATATVTLDGVWDLLSLPSFTSDGTHTSFNLRIYPTTAQVFSIDGVMVQAALGASSTYFDGNINNSTTYAYGWTGTSFYSTSTATPCGTVTIEADFQDDFGPLPVASVDIPLWYRNVINVSSGNSTTSIFQANTHNDNSGTDLEGFVAVKGTSLVNQPNDAATVAGSTYFVTFVSTYPLPAFITQLDIFGEPAKITYQINYEYQDQASISLYGNNPTNNGQPLLIQNDLIQNPSTAQSNATILVTDYNTAYKRLVADITPVPQMQIGDVISVGDDDITDTASMPSGLLLTLMQQGQAYSYAPAGLLLTLMQPQILPIYTEYVVVGISHSFTDDSPMQQVIEVEEKVLVNYFTIGSSAINGHDSIAPG